MTKDEFKAECERRRRAGLVLRGNTFPIKDKIKATGGIWDAREKAWLVKGHSDLDFLKAQMAAAPASAAPATSATATAKRSPSPAKRSSSPTKTCWECGCRFTFKDAKANEGDWNDSYCGC